MDRRGAVSCQHALFMLRWLARAPEEFLAGPPSEVAGVALPPARADQRLRWNLGRLYTALNDRRREEALTWEQLAGRLASTPSQLRGLRTTKFAVNMNLAMRVVQWLGRPASDFIDAAQW